MKTYIIPANAVPPAVQIRNAAPRDAARIATLAGQLGYSTDASTVANQLQTFAEHADHVVLVAVTPPEERIIAWVHAATCPLVHAAGFAEVHALVVDESCRGRGLGRLLMQHAENWAQGRGCSMIRLRSNVLRDRAHEFYEKLGYTQFKTQKAFRKTLPERPE